ncbi:MAG TPA: diguanylate cyclase [Opitutaceae bacterium]|jgi:diguanylate cyclase (GGDEF)-like protein|nr:diguanylate cyclase [Opitutaceae bacterium]
MPRTILLIDDDRLQFRLTEALFRNFRGEHYELDWAATYADGLTKLLGGAYAACLLDFQLGERDGLQLLREAVAQGCRTPVVFLTAESSAHVDIEAMNAGALDYLVKGELTPSALERSLRYALKLGDTLEALRLLATHDELTGLLNRREFDRLLAQEVERARRFAQPLGLVMADLDHFKSVNDQWGHQAGDEVLREVAVRLGASVRSVDWTARLGGEEFGFLLVQADGASACGAAERLREAVAGLPIVAQGRNLAITISLGVAVLPDHGSAGADLMAAADQALYAAKRAGRNRVIRAGT